MARRDGASQRCLHRICLGSGLFLETISLYVINKVDGVAVSAESPVRIPEVGSQEIWSPGGSPGWLSKGRDQIDFITRVQRPADLMVGLFLLDIFAFSLPD